MLTNAVATAVLLAELGIMLRYRLVHRRRERPSEWPQLSDVRYGHLAAALAAAAVGWLLGGAEASWGVFVTGLFLGTFVPASAALAVSVLWRPVLGWVVCVAGGLTMGLSSL
ncbi:hypothetical protein GCM10010329_11530 [Streptomyces spiroverticillatus]|uniref:DUF3325 domain-containing protein n=1 Tax=Streptomyces finlayi TaxID=67296 RepID=A0A918WXY5_9ACTN|nr:hypothetical protein [Streptomyces finlayi]GGZ92549.1 hypothetical protein GCM10010329_11530 [Streptomyces spiroverticillatus]GHC93011.1 hypothetical protein GCM10010334_29570 [Streptomyces finlayi]